MVTISNGTAEIVFIASHLHDSRQDLIRSVATFNNILLSSKDIITLVTNFLSLYFTTLVVNTPVEAIWKVSKLLLRRYTFASYKNDIAKIK